MDSARPLKFFCKQAGFVENKQLKLFLSVFFFKFYIWLSRLLSQNLENNSIEVIFELACGRKFSGGQ